MEVLDSPLDNTVAGDVLEPAPVVIKPLHFAILCSFTLGIYQIWWTYKCWRYFKQKESLDIYPVLRSIFNLFYGIGLYDKIMECTNSKGRRADYNSQGVWGGWLVLNLLSKLPDPFWIISILSFVPLIKVVREFNFYFTEDFNGGDVRMSSKQVIVIIAGALLWALIILDMNGVLDK